MLARQVLLPLESLHQSKEKEIFNECKQDSGQLDLIIEHEIYKYSEPWGKSI
jgi:hypothetical protein